MQVQKWLIAPMIAVAAFSMPARADDAVPTAPTLLVRLQSLDGLMANGKYIAALAGQEEAAKQFEKALPSFLGPKGLAGTGLDTTLPIGMYGILTPGVQDSIVVVMVPVADEKSFVETINNLLARFNVTANKGNDGIYTVGVPGLPFESYFTVADKYAYVTVRDKDPITAGKRLSAANLLKGDDNTVVSGSLRLDLIDKSLKQLALGQLENQMAAAKERKGPNETPTQTKLKVEMVDYFAKQIRSLMVDGKGIDFQATIDRKSDEIAVQLSLQAVDGTPLATEFKSLTNLPTRFAMLSGAAAQGGINVSVPTALRETFAAAIEDSFKQEMEKQKDAAKKEVAKKAYDALASTFKAGELDLRLGLVGPDASHHYTIVGGIKVQDADGIEKTVKELIPQIPDEKVKALITVDAETIGGVKVHKFVPPSLDSDAKRAFGEKANALVAFPKNAAVFAFGADPNAGIKQLLTNSGKPGAPFAGEAAIGQLASLDDRNPEAARKIANEVFGAKPQSDIARITVDGGNALRIRGSMNAQIIKFGVKMESLKKGGNE